MSRSFPGCLGFVWKTGSIELAGRMAISGEVLDRVAKAVGGEKVIRTQLIQALWSGYGDLFRAELAAGDEFSVIVKHIRLPQPAGHPRGWNNDRSHQRKLRSYQVEVNWYQGYANAPYAEAGQLDAPCPMPRCLFVEKKRAEILLVLEDLQCRGFTRVLERANQREIQAALRWLAYFHAQHLHASPQGLWKCGTYWHLDTRPDELAALDDPALRDAAHKIDAALKQCPFQTLVHGDAKLANFVFSPKGDRVAAVDFQYVGKGCGMKDVIMLLSSTVPTKDCERRCPPLLDDYFTYLKQAVDWRNATQPDQTIAFNQLEQAWRPLYCVAWADFQRFVKGWSPGHWKVHRYSEQLTRQALATLG